MTTNSIMKERLRLELGDFVQPFQATFEGDLSSLTWSLPHENIAVSEATPFSVRSVLSGTVVGWTLDAEFGLLTFASPPADGDTIVVDGYHAEVFSGNHLDSFINTSFALHNVRRNPPVTYSNVDGAEEYALVLKAKVQALWVLLADAARDIDIITVEGVRVPRSQRFQQLLAMLQAAERQYDDLVSDLNVGAGRIEQLRLRRKSRMTNRYVPIFLTQEIDDIDYPVRVLPPQDTEGAKLPVPTVETVDIQVYQGRSFSESLQLMDGDTPRDLNNYTYRAVLYRSPFTGTVDDSFNIIVDNAAEGQLSLTLTAEQTSDLETGYPYVYNFKIWDSTGEPTTVRRGSVLVETDIPSELKEE